MSDVDWTQVADILVEALELPPEERHAFVESRSQDRPRLRAAVQRLLAARESAGAEFLEGLDPEQIRTAVGRMGPVGERIGPWSIVREIGRGGMGEVYLAERADGQFDQQVALKLLKRGMDSDAILARFLRERQILAGLEHPNIARLLDGGIAGDNRPYLVMEYVDGNPITAFADAHRLSIDARLGLFRTVCDAVAYAHRSLVVHRDLKPSNILVTESGRPKLLDFGIAKLLSATDGAANPTTLTMDGARLLTPAYAAPEQIHGGPVTTATDVYGLGAVLYELLSGRQPFEDVDDRLRLPPDTEPATPSATVLREPDRQRHAASSADLAAARSTDPARLRRRLAGDLDTIVAAALRADPERRYRSVGDLEEDLRRHEEGLPVRVRPDTVGYRMSRFVGRHRIGVAATAAIAAVVLAFGVTASAQAAALAVERDRAQREAAAAREVSEFLVGVFEVADPMLPGYGDSVRATDLLDRGAERIESELAGQPAIQARMMGVIGRAYANLGQNDPAEPLLARAVDLERATEGESSAAVVAALQQLAQVRTELNDYAGAESTLREAIRIQSGIAPGDATMWSLLVDLAYAVHGTGDYTRGNAAVADALALFGRIPADAFGTARPSLRRLAGLVRLGLEREVADSVFARIVEIERHAAGEGSTPVAAALTSWAGAKAGQREWAVADSLITRAVAILAALDSTSVAMAGALGVQSDVEIGKGDLDRAILLERSSLAILQDRFGGDHLQVAITRSRLADRLETRGSFDEAVEQRRLANATLRREDNVVLANSEWRLGFALERTGRVDEALLVYERSLREFERRFPRGHLLAANLRRDYGKTLVDVGRSAEAEPMLRHAIEVLAARWGAEDSRVDIARISLGRALTDLGHTDEAEDLLRGALDRLTTSRGPDDELTRRAREALERSRAR